VPFMADLLSRPVDRIARPRAALRPAIVRLTERLDLGTERVTVAVPPMIIISDCSNRLGLWV